MGGQRILEFDLHAVARERTIPTGGVAQADDKIVSVHQPSFDLFARRQRYGGSCVRAVFAVAGIKHARFELNRRIFGGDASKIAGGRMTGRATTSSVEESLAGVSVAGE